MSGALKSVFGGGNLFGTLLSIASIAFPPAALATSMSNLLATAVGEAVKMAASKLVQESGMPKFVGDLVNTAVDQAVPQHLKESDAGADEFLASNDKVQDSLADFTQKLSDSFVENARKGVAREAEKKSGSGSGKVSGGSWLTAIAEAMGETMGEKAADMVGLSQQMADLTAQSKSIGKDDTKAQQENAKEFSMVQAKFQSASQEYSILSNTFANAIKSIGEGLSAMGRKG